MVNDLLLYVTTKIVQCIVTKHMPSDTCHLNVVTRRLREILPKKIHTDEIYLFFWFERGA